MQTLVLDKNNFLSSVSIANDVANGGYSPAKGGHNLVKEQGVLYSQPSATDLSTNLEGNVIATAIDNNITGNDRYLLDDEGKFYTLNGTTLTKRQTGTKTYQVATSDFLNFKGNIYATSTSDITLLTGSNLTTIDETWWTVTRGHAPTTGSYRKPMEVVEDTMYIGDKNKIHTWDGTTSVSGAMTLPSHLNITALIKHPNGRDLLVFTTSTANYSGTLASPSFMHVVDTVRLEFVREVPLEEMVTGGINVAGKVFVGYGTNLGIVTDGGVQFLRKLNIARGGSTLAYKHHFSAFSHHMLVIEGDKVLAYGDLGQGDVFWYPVENTTGISIDVAFGYGNNKLCYATQNSSGTEKLYLLNFDDGGVGSTWRSNPISFARQVWIRRIDVIHTTTSGTSIFNLQNVDQGDESITTIKQVSYSGETVSKSRVDCNILADIFQFQLVWSNNALGFKKFVIYYEPAE